MPYYGLRRRGLRRRPAGAARQRSVRAVPDRPEAAPVQHALHDGGRPADRPAAVVPGRASSPMAAAARIAPSPSPWWAPPRRQSIYYFPKSDVAATAIASRAIDCGSARGYGALETLTATELMIDEIAGELGLDPIEFRLRNVLKTGMKNTQGAIPLGTQRAEAVLEQARGACAVDRPCRAQAGLRRGASRQILRRRFRLHPAALRHRRRSELRQGRARAGWPHHALPQRHGDRHRHILGAGRRLRALAGPAGRCARDGRHRLARPAGGDERRSAYAMSQAEQDRLAANPRWTPAFASASSASNSSYYFTHTTREAARIVFLHGLWPAALAIWGTAARRRHRARRSPRTRAGATARSRSKASSRCRWRGWRRRRMRAAS